MRENICSSDDERTAETIDFSTVPGARTWNSIAAGDSLARVLLSRDLVYARIKAAVVLSIR